MLRLVQTAFCLGWFTTSLENSAIVVEAQRFCPSGSPFCFNIRQEVLDRQKQAKAEGFSSSIEAQLMYDQLGDNADLIQGTLFSNENSVGLDAAVSNSVLSEFVQKSAEWGTEDEWWQEDLGTPILEETIVDEVADQEHVSRWKELGASVLCEQSPASYFCNAAEKFNDFKEKGELLNNQVGEALAQAESDGDIQEALRPFNEHFKEQAPAVATDIGKDVILGTAEVVSQAAGGVVRKTFDQIEWNVNTGKGVAEILGGLQMIEEEVVKGPIPFPEPDFTGDPAIDLLIAELRTAAESPPGDISFGMEYDMRDPDQRKKIVAFDVENFSMDPFKPINTGVPAIDAGYNAAIAPYRSYVSANLQRISTLQEGHKHYTNGRDALVKSAKSSVTKAAQAKVLSKLPIETTKNFRTALVLGEKVRKALVDPSKLPENDKETDEENENRDLRRLRRMGGRRHLQPQAPVGPYSNETLVFFDGKVDTLELDFDDSGLDNTSSTSTQGGRRIVLPPTWDFFARVQVHVKLGSSRGCLGAFVTIRDDDTENSTIPTATDINTTIPVLNLVVQDAITGDVFALDYHSGLLRLPAILGQTMETTVCVDPSSTPYLDVVLAPFDTSALVQNLSLDLTIATFKEGFLSMTLVDYAVKMRKGVTNRLEVKNETTGEYEIPADQNEEEFLLSLEPLVDAAVPFLPPSAVPSSIPSNLPSQSMEPSVSSMPSSMPSASSEPSSSDIPSSDPLEQNGQSAPPFVPSTTEPSSRETLPSTKPSGAPSNSLVSAEPSVVPTETAASGTLAPTPVGDDCDPASVWPYVCNDGCGDCNTMKTQNGEVGCSCKACECYVCSVFPDCCNVQWGSVCAVIAASACSC